MYGRSVGRGRAKPKEVSSGYGSLSPASVGPTLPDGGRDVRSSLAKLRDRASAESPTLPVVGKDGRSSLAILRDRASAESPSSVTKGKIDVNEGNSQEYNRILSENIEKCVLQPIKMSAAQRVHSDPPVKAQGTNGTRTQVETNCMKLTYKTGQAIHQYHVKIYPEVDDSKRRHKLVSLAVSFKRGIRCFNGDQILYLPYKVPNSVKDVELDNSFYKIDIILTAVLDMAQCLPFFGTLIRNCCKAVGFNLVGRSFYDLKTGVSIAQHNYKVWSGFLTAVDEKEDGVYLTIDSTSRVLRTETAYMVLKKLERSNPQNFRTEATKAFVGTSVLTHYNNLMYRVDDILWTGSPSTTNFKLLDGTQITIKEYVWKQHKIELIDDNQPLFVTKCRRKGPLQDALIYLVPELCQLTGITDEMRQDYQVMKELVSYTKLDPRARRKNLKDFIKTLKDNEESRKMLDEWGLQIADEPEVVDARILPPVEMVFGNGVKTKVVAEWKNSRGQAPYRSADIRNWVLFHIPKDTQRVNDFLETISSAANGLGVVLNRPRVCVLPNDRVATIVPAIENNIDETTQIIVFIMSNQRSDIYAAVKKLCICDRAVASQMVLSYTLSKPQRLRAVVNNILLQMVAKLGGALWRVQLPTKETMFCGIDTYHDKGGKHSVAGFVAAIDNEATKYFSQVALQDPSIDLLLAAYRSVSNSLNAYMAENGKLPTRIFVFRDGVSQGDFVGAQREIVQLKEACRHYKPGYNPNMVFVLCVKRINLRYYTLKGTNAEPGTIVDSTVTMRNYPDFMIVSQKSTQGTLTPTHYVVLQNESNLNIGQIQMITHWFCHMYYNWSGSVRVPAPCLYAHKLAGMIGIIQKHPHGAMEKNLYYL